MKKGRIAVYLRYTILAIMLIALTLKAYLHQVLGGGVAPSVHAVCPYGGLEALYSFFGAGTLISKIYTGTMLLFIITIVLAIVFRRAFCGILCPFGALQELFGRLGRKIFKRNLIMSTKIDKPMRYLKYVVLAITVFFAWKTAGLWMAPYDPWSAYAHISEGFSNLWKESAVGLILLIVTIIGSLLYDRFFCKYLCPMGAFYGIVGKLSPYKVERNEEKCINCGLCTKKCPVNIDVANSKKITSAECINCQECVVSCPKEGALENKFSKKVVEPIIAIVLVIILFFVPIFTAKIMGAYNVLPERIEKGTVINVEEVKGYMSIKEAAEYTKVDIKEFYKLFKIPQNVPESTKMNKIGDVAPGYSFHDVKAALESEAK